MGAQPMMTVQTIQHVRMESASTLVPFKIPAQLLPHAESQGMRQFAPALMDILAHQPLIADHVCMHVLHSFDIYICLAARQLFKILLIKNI